MWREELWLSIQSSLGIVSQRYSTEPVHVMAVGYGLGIFDTVIVDLLETPPDGKGFSRNPRGLTQLSLNELVSKDLLGWATVWGKLEESKTAPGVTHLLDALALVKKELEPFQCAPHIIYLFVISDGPPIEEEREEALRQLLDIKERGVNVVSIALIPKSREKQEVVKRKELFMRTIASPISERSFTSLLAAEAHAEIGSEHYIQISSAEDLREHFKAINFLGRYKCCTPILLTPKLRAAIMVLLPPPLAPHPGQEGSVCCASMVGVYVVSLLLKS